VPRNLNNKQKDLLREFEKLCDKKNNKKQSGFLDKIKDVFKH
jgi:DnaJ-class molecular chaperone